MARPRKPPSPAAQAANAQRQAANQAARNASVYWQQQAKPKKKPATPGAAPYSDPTSPTSYANPTATPGGISVGGVPPIVPTQFDQWLQSYQPYRDAIDAAQADRATQIARGTTGIANALSLYGGDLTAFKDALNKALGADQNGSGQMFLQSLMGLDGANWNTISRAACDADAGGVSIMAQLQRAQAERQGALESDLANRGIIWSGQNTAGTAANETQRARDEWGEQQKLIQYLTGLTSAFAESEAQRAGAIRQAATGAEDYYRDENNQIPGVAGMSGAVGAGDPTAPPPDVSTPAVSPKSPSKAARREAYRRRRAAAQAAAARARAAAQGRTV